jgi:Bax protein
MKLSTPLNYALMLTGLASTVLLTACDQSPDPEIQKVEPTISISEKKANFFAHLQPMIEQANSEVLAQRKAVFNIQSELPQLSDKQNETFAELIHTYRVDKNLPPEQQATLLISKVNTIPAALILAQAANESAWGTSRFAREGNNYFGQWCFTKGCGIVPNSRNSGADHEVASFDSPLGSVKSYIRNLNSHPTYQVLRDLRDQAIKEGNAPSGELLAQGLIGYSERGEEYIKEIQSMIRYNKLSRFDAGSIEQEAPSDSGKG